MRTSESSRILQILHVGRRAFIEDHQIDGELLEPPIFMGAQQLAHEFEIVGFCDVNQHDGQIARNSLRP